MTPKENDEPTNPGTRALLRQFLVKAANELEKCAQSLRTIESRIDNVAPHRIKGVLANLSVAVGETADLLDDCRRYLKEQSGVLG